MHMNSSESQLLEARARRAARRVGLRVRKSRQRTYVPNMDNFGAYMLIDGERGYVVAGSKFDLSAEEVIAFCARLGPSSPMRHG
jgi:hypothetical protein